MTVRLLSTQSLKAKTVSNKKDLKTSPILRFASRTERVTNPKACLLQQPRGYDLRSPSTPPHSAAPSPRDGAATSPSSSRSLPSPPASLPIVGPPCRRRPQAACLRHLIARTSSSSRPPALGTSLALAATASGADVTDDGTFHGHGSGASTGCPCSAAVGALVSSPSAATPERVLQVACCPRCWPR